MLDRILDAIGRFSYKCRRLVAVCACVLLAAATTLQFFVGITYSYYDYNKVTDVFPEDDTLVIVYDNRDEDKAAGIVEELSSNEHVTSLYAYSNTLGSDVDPNALDEGAGMDEMFVRTLTYIRKNGTGTDGLTVREFIGFISSEGFSNNRIVSGRFNDEMRATLAKTEKVVNGAAEGTEFDAPTLAELTGTDEMSADAVLTEEGVSSLTVGEFADALLEAEARDSETLSEEQTESVRHIKTLCELVGSDRKLSPAELSKTFASETDGFDENAVTFLCLMYDASVAEESGERVSNYDFFDYLTTKLLTDAMFDSLLDEETKDMLSGATDTIENAKAQLVGKDHSRIILTLDYEIESEEMYNFFRSLEAELDERFEYDSYLVGNSAMSNELSKTFRGEYLLLSVITAAAIFAVVLITFRKFSVSLLLVCIIECAVFITMSVMTIAGESMYFLAVIIVQCILMGSMVDYGILLSNYYVEVRREYPVEEALPEVLKRSIRAIATSALIIIAMTFVCGFVMTDAVSHILKTLCIGSFSALVLVIFVLPSLLAIFDKRVTKKRKARDNTDNY